MKEVKKLYDTQIFISNHTLKMNHIFCIEYDVTGETKNFYNVIDVEKSSFGNRQKFSKDKIGLFIVDMENNFKSITISVLIVADNMQDAKKYLFETCMKECNYITKELTTMSM